MHELPPVSAIADVLALGGSDGWLTPPLRPVVAPNGAVSGRAVTVQLRAVPEGGGLGELQRLLSGDLSGSVVVIAGAVPVGGAVWGEILSRAARAAGAAAVLVDGFVRDRTAMAAEGLPVYATDEAVVGPAGRAAVVAVGVPVTIGGCEVAPGDVVVGDAGGVVRVASDASAAVLDDARRYAEAEARVLDRLAAGETLLDAYTSKRDAVAALEAELVQRSTGGGSVEVSGRTESG